MDHLHSRARNRLFRDPRRLDRYVTIVAERLSKTRDEALDWLEQMFEEDNYELIDAIVHGVDAGRIAYSDDEPPRSLGGLTTS